jgi:hypothetical protein
MQLVSRTVSHSPNPASLTAPALENSKKTSSKTHAKDLSVTAMVAGGDGSVVTRELLTLLREMKDSFEVRQPYSSFPPTLITPPLLAIDTIRWLGRTISPTRASHRSTGVTAPAAGQVGLARVSSSYSGQLAALVGR